jgi:TIR domain
MADDFTYDVFLSHSSKDKAVVRAVAERLHADNLRVWFDEWELKPGDSIPAKIEAGLEDSRVLVLCMSAQAFGSDWAMLESQTFRFRDPLNKERRFIPLRLDEAQLKGSLAQFLYINWLPEDREQEYAKLLEACRPPAKPPAVEVQAAPKQVAEKAVQLDYPEERVLNGDLTYHSSMARLDSDEERFVLLAMHQTLVERCLCLREHTDKGHLLVFPSFYRRERPDLVGHPAVLVSYRFNGFLDDIYATLVVRLHHTQPFQQDQLWRYAADFKTLAGKQLGVKLTRRAEGAGELEVYFDPTISVGERSFSANTSTNTCCKKPARWCGSATTSACTAARPSATARWR